MIEKVHDIARSGSTVILTIHQPSSRILLMLDHLIVLARGQLMFQGSPKDVPLHLGRMGRKVPKGENSIEYLIDVIQEYDQSEHGVEALAAFVRTGMKPPPLSDEQVSLSTVALSLTPKHHGLSHQQGLALPGSAQGRRLHLETSGQYSVDDGFDHSVRSPYSNTPRSWTPSRTGVLRALRLTPSRQRNDEKMQNAMR